MLARRIALIIFVLSAPAIEACDQSGSLLVVHLSTDRNPETDFDRVEWTVSDLSTGEEIEASERAVDSTSDYRLGIQLVSLELAADREYLVRVSLHLGDDLVAERSSPVTIFSSVSVVVDLPGPACAATDEVCNSLDDDCDGAIDEGDASTLCALRDVVESECRNGICEVLTCPGGREDCDGQADNGCEAAPMSDAAHCGGCGHACAEGTQCSLGECRYMGVSVAERLFDGGSPAAGGAFPIREGFVFSRTVWVDGESMRRWTALNYDLSTRWELDLREQCGSYSVIADWRPLLGGGSEDVYALVGLRTFSPNTCDLGPFSVDVNGVSWILARFDGATGRVESQTTILDSFDAYTSANYTLLAADDRGALVGYVDYLEDEGTRIGEVILFDRDGEEEWRYRVPGLAPISILDEFPGGALTEDHAFVVLDPWVTGVRDFGSGPVVLGSDNGVLLAFDREGRPQWTRRFRGSFMAARLTDEGEIAMVVKPLGSSPYVEHRSTDGEFISSHFFALPAIRVTDVFLSPNGDIYSVGEVQAPVTFDDGTHLDPLLETGALTSVSPTGEFRFVQSPVGEVATRFTAAAEQDGYILVATSFEGTYDFGNGEHTGSGTMVLLLRD